MRTIILTDDEIQWLRAILDDAKEDAISAIHSSMPEDKELIESSEELMRQIDHLQEVLKAS